MSNNMNIFNRKILIIFVLLAGLIFSHQPLEGQIIFGQPPSGDLKFIYQSWTITDSADVETKLTQWVVPVFAFVPVMDNWEIIFSSSTAGTSLDTGGDSDSDLSGLNDTRITVYRSFLDDRFLFGLGLNLPTGKKALSVDEIGVSGMLTESFLNLPIKSYGEGVGLNIETGYAQTFDIYTVGAGIGYTIKSKYEPLDGIDNYKPGNHLRIGAFGSLKKENFNGRASLVFNIFAKDKLDDEPVFKDGNMIDAKLEFGYTHEKLSTLLGIRQIVRGKDDRVDGSGLETEIEKSHGPETRIFGQSIYQMRENYSLKVLLDFKRVGANGYDEDHERAFGSSDYFGIGIGGGAVFAESFSGFAEFEYFTGSADDGTLDLSGWQLAIGMGATF